ncbi:MAG: ASKHA domain-containing protein [Alphaproteobacteria bacterium]|uniref:ASKHA domain-containing protein n=1 Tax=Candidatus Nitrobium versatile TaxID=2884831 RepID=A0A953M3G6_9BACT|nr:ASKHA domain-containing protein [Candidatus Nitrobium versatile]
MEHTIIFQPSGRRGQVPEGTTILEASRRLGVEIEAPCGEQMVCGKCRVKVMEGNFPKEGITSSMSHLSPQDEKELKVLERKESEENVRLACVTKVYGDILIFVPEGSRTGKQIVSKAARKIKVKLKPAVRKYYVELPEPNLDDPLGDFERLEEALAKDHGLKKLTIDYRALQKLPDVARQSDWKMTATVWMDREVIRVEPGKVETNIGLAVDIGSTTCASYLTDLNTGEVLATESMMNPQVRYGDDVMSRITYCMLNENTGLKELQGTIIEGLNTMVANAAKKAGFTTEDISEMTVVGNTAQHHLLLGINPEFMGVAPFTPALHASTDIKAERFGINILPGGNVHVLPIEAGFVGADNVGCLLADEPQKRKEITLLIDIGTNGELILGNKDKLLSCSCATGPALEGAQIEFGMRAAPGAIERIKIDEKTLEPTYRVIGNENWSDGKTNMKAKGICGSAIIDGIAEMFRAGILKKNGNVDMEVKSDRIRMGEKGVAEYVLAWKHETSIDHDIVINQKDVRAIQLAKGALYSGCVIMMRKLGVKSFDRLAIAGAFGSHIDKVAAMLIGMYPDCPLDKVEYVGNAAGDGARIALLNIDKRKEANEVARRVEYVELALEEDFNDRFGEAMQFPHMVDEFPHLKDILPPVK